MKFISTILLLSFSLLLKAQLFLPKFDPPKKVDALNGQAEESMPLPYNNGKSIYFVRTFIDGSLKEKSLGQDIFQSEYKDGKWTEANNLFKELNDRGNNAVIGTSANGDRVYVFNSIQSRKRLARGLAYLKKDENGKWSKLIRINIPNFKIGKGYYSFYMNPDETVLLISMSPDNSALNEDLFVTRKDEAGEWMPIVSLGETINTSGYESSPYIAKDNKTLYFSSDGHKGFGDADIFVSYRMDDSWTNWTTPLNMGEPINSDAYDAYFIMGNNKEIFFTSNRGQEYSDIYYTKTTGEVRIGVPVIAQFRYNGLAGDSTRLKIYDENGNLIDEVVTDQYGQFSFYKLHPDSNYVVKLAADEPKNFPGAVVYLVDNAGLRYQRLIVDSEGNFVPDNKYEDVSLVEGVFNYNQLPVKNTQIVIFDENGFPIDTILTDAFGRFNYQRIDRDENISIGLLNEGDDGGLVYFVDEEGNKVARYVVSSDEAAKKIQLFKGLFKYNQLAMKNSTLVIYDENGFPIDTIITDEFGRFDYNRLGVDENITIKPLNGEDASGLVYFMDENGNRIARYVVSNKKEDLNPDVLKGLFKYNQLAMKNTTIIIYDENGFPLDTILTDEFGRFNFSRLGIDENLSIKPFNGEGDGGLVYFTDENGNRVAKYVVKGGKDEINYALIEGIFKYKGLPLQNSQLIVYDEYGNPVDTIFTDQYGKFNYDKISSDGIYTIRPLDAEDANGLVYYLDENGKRVSKYEQSEEERLAEAALLKGIFKYKQLPLKNEMLVVYDENGVAIDTIMSDEFGRFEYNKISSDQEFTLRPLNYEDAGGLVYYIDENGKRAARYEQQRQAVLNSNVFSGVFKYNNLPVKSTSLVVYDENGVAIDTIVTDDYGRFQFNKFALENNYTVKPLNSNDVEGLVYVTDENGNRVARYIVSKNGEAVNDALLNKILVEGLFKYNQLPAQEEGLVIYDKNGFALDTIYTDQYGKFTYDKLKLDQVFYIKPLDADEKNLSLVDIDLREDNKPKEADRSDLKGKGFAYNSFQVGVKTKAVDYSFKPDPNYKAQENDDYIIYFFYNDWVVKANDQAKIDAIANSIKAGREVKLVGHTDNIGSEGNNLKVGKMRAEAVREYLIKKGISVNEKIKIITHGQRYPVGTNETSQGRGKNRRVEIFVK